MGPTWLKALLRKTPAYPYLRAGWDRVRPKARPKNWPSMTPGRRPPYFAGCSPRTPTEWTSAHVGGFLAELVQIAPKGKHVAVEPIPTLAGQPPCRLPPDDRPRRRPERLAWVGHLPVGPQQPRVKRAGPPGRPATGRTDRADRGPLGAFGRPDRGRGPGRPGQDRRRGRRGERPAGGLQSAPGEPALGADRTRVGMPSLWAHDWGLGSRVRRPPDGHLDAGRMAGRRATADSRRAVCGDRSWPVQLPGRPGPQPGVNSTATDAPKR